MTDSAASNVQPPESDPKKDFRVGAASDDAGRRLAQAIEGLGNDADYFLDALTEKLLSMEPLLKPEPDDDSDRAFLIASGSFSADEYDDARRSVARGSLQLRVVESWFSSLAGTLSLKAIAGFLHWSDDEVTTAVADGRLYAVEISGRLRFPEWQLSLSSPGKLLPGLTEVIAAASSEQSWIVLAGIMGTPQEDLYGEGNKTPVAWLRDGGDVRRVTNVVMSPWLT
ncbi:hypothetical protein IFT77_16155 [Frigoribacterium sp. CFBP 13729]|uniref:hypothetical protein n=1 Tax=Frigoribacterium sp. CFBP 13729 TaxID=2775293 RepID=UPI001785BEBD|nr:hypothetical protein [Frigoribacterium sp. CFBP 13729]MBD8612025.1 hypothetical protein [Frigoribacterium sp. CFBP 13729]